MVTPFEVLYGYSPDHFGISVAEATPITDLSSWLAERNRMMELIQQHLVRAKDHMKKYADAKCSEQVFQVGDWVFLKIQPYVQSSLASRANPKPSFKFFGPFQVLARVGSVAYKLALPASSSIHPVVHVSQLKKAPGPPTSVTALPDDLALQWSIPERIFQERIIPRDMSSVRQVVSSTRIVGFLGRSRRGSYPDGGDHSAEDDRGPAVTDGPERRKGQRTRKPAVVSGPEWAK